MDNTKVQSVNPKEDISKSSPKDNFSSLNTTSMKAVQYNAGNANAEVNDTHQTVPLLDNARASYANNNPIVTKTISELGDPFSDESRLPTINATVERPDTTKEVKSNASLDTGKTSLSETKETVAETEAGSTKDVGKQLETTPPPPHSYPKQIDEFNHKPVIDVDRNDSSFDSTKKDIVIKRSSDLSSLMHEQKESNSKVPSSKSPEPTMTGDLSAVSPLTIQTTGIGSDQGHHQPKSPAKVDSSPKFSPGTNKKVESSGVVKNDDITAKPEESKPTTIPCEQLSSPKAPARQVSEVDKNKSGESTKEMDKNRMKIEETSEKESNLSSNSKAKTDEKNDLYYFDGKEPVVEEVIMKKDVMKAGTDDKLIEEWRKSEDKTRERKKQDSKKDNLPPSLDDQIFPKSSLGDQVMPGRQTITKDSVVENILDDIVTSLEEFAYDNKSHIKNPQGKNKQKDTKEIKKEKENAYHAKDIKREIKNEIIDEIEHKKKHTKEENKNIAPEQYKKELKHDESFQKEMKRENKETEQIFQSKEDGVSKDLKKGPQFMKEEHKQTDIETKEVNQTSKSLNQELQKTDTTEKQIKQHPESPLNKNKQESKQKKESPGEKEKLREVSKSPLLQKKEDRQIKGEAKEIKQMLGMNASPVKTRSGKEKRQENQTLTNLSKTTPDEKKTNTTAKYGCNQKESKSATAKLKQEKELKEKHTEIVNAVKRLLPEEGHDSGVDESTQSKDGGSKEAPKDGRKSPQKRQPRSMDPSPMKRTPQTTASAERKLPMNKVEVGKSASPNIKNVKSKIGSLDNSTYKPGGGKVKIESKKLDFSKASSRIAAKNEKYSPGGGEKKIEVVKLKWNASSKVGSLDKKDHKPGGGDKKVESHKLNFREKAESKVGSKDNIKHKAGGGDVEIPTEKLEFKSKATSKVGSLDNVKHKAQGGDKKIFDDKDYLRQIQSSSSASPCKTPTSRTSSGRASGAISPATTGTISPGPQEE